MRKIFFSTIAIILVIGGIFIAKKFFPPPLCKIAVVVDDFGYNINNIDEFLEIKSPLTLAILPNLPHSKEILEKAKQRKYEVILHMPLEPRLGADDNTIRLEKNTILVKMPEEKILEILRNNIEELSGIKGVSNHMGSRATGDYRTMSIILLELKRRNLYFLDSCVTGESICREVARKNKLGFATRDVFLDGSGKAEPQYIKAQIKKLVEEAKERKQAIGICHDRASTAAVLRETMPVLKKQGVKFVFVSELVR